MSATDNKKFIDSNTRAGSRIAILSGFLLCVWFCAGSISAQPAPPLTHLTKELRNGCGVLYLALRPGEEDAGLLAYLKTEKGFTVSGAFVTNGEALIQDDDDRPAAFRIERNKESAVTALGILGLRHYFMNLPDPGYIPFGMNMDGWNPDTIVRRLAVIIRIVKPHVIIAGTWSLAGDTITAAGMRAYGGLLRNAVALAGRDSIGAEIDRKLEPWKVQQVYIESAGKRDRGIVLADGARRSVAGLATAYHVPYRHLAGRIRGERASVYVRQGSGKSKPASMFDTGVTLSTESLRDIEKLVRKAAVAVETRGDGGLTDVVAALNEVDAAIPAGRQVLPPLDRRRLAQWKILLERIRTACNHPAFTVTVSDSLIAESELFYVSVKGIDSLAQAGETTIRFARRPEEGWIYNESDVATYNAKTTTEFSVVTPDTLDVAYPVSVHGLNKRVLRFPFVIVVLHRGATQERTFISQIEFPMRISAFHQFELLNPVVAAGRDTRARIRVFSSSRDATQGDLWLRDSVIGTGPIHFAMTKGSNFLEYALPLRWPAQPPNEEKKIECMAGRTVAGSLTIRPLQPRVDAGISCAVITDRHASAVAEALARLGARCAQYAPVQWTDAFIAEQKVIVIDRGCYEHVLDAGSNQERIRDWVSGGGTLVMLPQFGGKFSDGAAYTAVWRKGYAPVVSNVLAAAGRPVFLQKPFPVDAEGLMRISQLKAEGVLSENTARETEVSVTDASGKRPVLMCEREGRGRIIYSALRWEDALAELEPAVYALLANIVSAGN